MKRQFRYDYYYVHIPDDLGTWADRANAALAEARERSKLWVSCCEWMIVREMGELMVVRRKRYAS